LKIGVATSIVLSTLSLLLVSWRNHSMLTVPQPAGKPSLDRRHGTDFPPKLAAETTPNHGAAEDQAYLAGVDLPVTNKLCNKKGTFCIYDLERLIHRKTAQATYRFSEVQNGELVSINGVIEISTSAEQNDNSSLLFPFRDDQSTTTPGWAGSGYFSIGKSASKPGIRTLFTVTESYGPKTPVGLENEAYVYPQ